MNFIESVIEEDYDAILKQCTEQVALDLQTVGAAQGKQHALELLKKQYDYLQSTIKEVKIFREFEDDKHKVIEYDLKLSNTFDLPLAVILVKDGHQFSGIRTYHSVYPITEGHIFRPSIFTKTITLTEPTEVVAYFDAIGDGAIDETMQTLSFKDDVYFREPAGWRWNHRTREGLHKHFSHFFSDGGVPLKFHNAIYDKEIGTFAGEYSCDVWGSKTFKPQAGISIYDINKTTGKIKGIRVYDNVDVSYQ